MDHTSCVGFTLFSIWSLTPKQAKTDRTALPLKLFGVCLWWHEVPRSNIQDHPLAQAISSLAHAKPHHVCLRHSEDELPPRWPQVEFAIWKVDLDSSVTWWNWPMWFQFFVGEAKTASPQRISTLGPIDTFPTIILTSLWTHLFASFCTQEGI